jgi:predicted O-methyltransferase YrrM
MERADGEPAARQRWTAVDRYITDLLLPPEPALDAALEASGAAGLPAIQVAPNQGALLQLLAQAQGAQTILEIGTLGAYSTIWLASALPKGGRLVTLELEPSHADVALVNLDRAGLAAVVEVRLGPALDSLAELAAEKHRPFDLVFIDADKPSTTAHFDWALRLSRRGSLIIVDNVVRAGALIDADSDDPDVIGMRDFMEALSAEPRVRATALQTVGSKGYDGFALVLVTADP